MQRILVGRWWFYLALLSFVLVWVIGQVAGWISGSNTINGYSPTPALFLVPLAMVLSSYAVGGPLARRQWIRGELVERWFFLVGVGTYVGGYAVDVLIGPQFNPVTGAGSYSFPGSLILSMILLGLAAGFGHEPELVVPRIEAGPDGVPTAPVAGFSPPRIVPSTAPAAPAPRTLDRALLVIALVALALLFVVWTGYEPAVYGPQAVEWTLEYRVCGPGGNSTNLPFYEHHFPLWAQVHVAWSANEKVFVTTYGPAGPYFGGLGTSGNWSFVSNAQPVVFSLNPLPTPPCGNVTAQFDATISL